MRCIGIIPAKGTSQRIPQKNIAPLNGKPLVQYAMDAALESGIFDKIIVSTEDELIKLFLNRYILDKYTKGSVVQKNPLVIHKRQPCLSTDTATVYEVCQEILKHFECDSFCVLLPTSPLRDAWEVKQAYNTFNSTKAECLMSVTELEHHPAHALKVCKHGKVHPYDSEGIKRKRQELEPVYKHDGSIIFCKVDAFLKHEDWFDMDIVPYYIPRERAVDVNEPIDLMVCEALMSHKND